jgi:CMP-N-acetylneuraminic acid synthetase
MYKNKTILAIVPARGNSKGIKNKNLKKIKGLSLVEHAGNVLKKISWIDYSIISSDSDKIIEAAKKSSLECIFKRPKNISGHRISDHSVMIHALKAVEKSKKDKIDIILLVQPTSPLRKVIDIKNVIKKIVDEKLESVWTISKTDLKFHPLKQLTLKKNILSHYNKKGKGIIARQQLNNTYYRNGVAYAVTRELVLKNKNLISKKSSGYLINTPQISIDTVGDLKLASQLM